MMIKVCGMKHAQNIKNVSALSIDWMGFIHYPKSKRHVSLETLATVLPLVRKEVRKVAVVVNESFSIMRKLKALGVDLMQLHGSESPEMCLKVRQFSKVIKVFSVNADFDFEETKAFEGICDYFLFDAKGKLKGGNGIQYDWTILQKYKGETPFLLSGGIRPEDVERLKAFQHPKCVGIDINSGFEIEPALKDEESLKVFVTRY